MKPWVWLFRTRVTHQANVFNTAKPVDHLGHSSDRNGGSLKVQPRFKCLKIAFHDSGHTSIFKTTCCRDSENPEVYQLSVPCKHDVTWRQSNAERNWYMTSSQTPPGPAAFCACPEPDRAARAPAVTGASPCLRTGHGHIQTLLRNEPAVGLTGTRGISQPAKPPSSAGSQGRDSCPDTVNTAHTECQTSQGNTKHSLPHLYIFIAHLSSWHGSVSILTFKTLWHSTVRSTA